MLIICTKKLTETLDEVSAALLLIYFWLLIYIWIFWIIWIFRHTFKFSQFNCQTYTSIFRYTLQFLGIYFNFQILFWTSRKIILMIKIDYLKFLLNSQIWRFKQKCVGIIRKFFTLYDIHCMTNTVKKSFRQSVCNFIADTLFECSDTSILRHTNFQTHISIFRHSSELLEKQL